MSVVLLTSTRNDHAADDARQQQDADGLKGQQIAILIGTQEPMAQQRDVKIERDIQDEFRRRDHERDVDEQERDELRKQEEEEWRKEEKQRIKERREALKRQKEQLKKELEENE